VADRRIIAAGKDSGKVEDFAHKKAKREDIPCIIYRKVWVEQK
jgi:hypothetical protein